jgi:hypothetical protein
MASARIQFSVDESAKTASGISSGVLVSVPWVRMRVYSDVIGIAFRVTLFTIYLFKKHNSCIRNIFQGTLPLVTIFAQEERKSELNRQKSDF